LKTRQKRAVKVSKLVSRLSAGNIGFFDETVSGFLVETIYLPLNFDFRSPAAAMLSVGNMNLPSRFTSKNRTVYRVIRRRFFSSF